MLRLIHTADWQLGKPYGRFDSDVRWTCPGKVESSLEVKGELDDEAETVHEGI